MCCQDDAGDEIIVRGRGGIVARTVTETHTSLVNGERKTVVTIKKYDKDGNMVEKVVKDGEADDESDDEVMTPRRPLQRTQTGNREYRTQKAGGSGNEDVDDFKREILATHNDYRAKHGVPALQWSNECEKNAQACADQCEARSRLQHSHHRESGQGQNAFMAMPAKTGAEACASWYSEIKQYNFGANRGSGTGHFTQVVWKDTTHMGAARSKSGHYIVGNYSPAGNLNQNQPSGNARNVQPLVR